MNQLTVLVDMPAYNHADLACRAIDSVLEQPFPRLWPTDPMFHPQESYRHQAFLVLS